MGLDDIKNKIGDLASTAKEKGADVVDTVKGALGDEEKTDAALTKAADFVNDKTGGRFEDKVSSARDAADSKLGDDLPGKKDEAGQ